ncbi:MAG: glutamate--tRNA ligase, partial [Alphaproteobacteria bacterium]
NFLAFLGWNPGTEQEVFTLDELCQAFSLDKVSKGGARFDFDKARWFNQQHILRMDSRELARRVRPWIEKHGPRPDEDYLVAFCELMKERVTLLPDFWTEGYYFFVPVRQYDEAAIKKRWQPGRRPAMEGLIAALDNLSDWTADAIGQAIKQYLTDHNLKFGDVLPFVRLALAGTMKGPGVNEMIALLGKETTLQRLREGLDLFDRLVTANVESAD